MACKEETRTIGDNSYYCRQWDAEKAILMKFKLAKMFGGAFSALALVVTKGVDADLQKTMSTVFDDKDPKEVLELMKEVVSSSTCKRSDQEKYEKISVTNFNEIYSDNLLEFYKAFAFVLEVNYKNFLGDKLPTILESLKKVQEKSGNEI